MLPLPLTALGRAVTTMETWGLAEALLWALTLAQVLLHIMAPKQLLEHECVVMAALKNQTA